jgi:hypothetical protein
MLLNYPLLINLNLKTDTILTGIVQVLKTCTCIKKYIIRVDKYNKYKYNNFDLTF